MARLLVLVAAFLLLGQWSYAAAGSYCSHEEGKPGVAAHWGHHFHAHQAGGEPDGVGKSSKSKVAAHGDCGFCHAGTVALAAATFVAAAASEVSVSDAAPPDLIGIVPDRPDRPNWHVPAFA